MWYSGCMSKKAVTFIATKYKNKPTQVSFYTKQGERVKFAATEKVPSKTRVSFRVKN
jgi:hypothetical protein